ncbi:MAG: DUF2845 domain-containing protein [Desulfobacterales bacterium]|jgi:hypothetical protein
MNVKISYVSAFLALMMIFASKLYGIDFWSLNDQSTYRCPGGLVSIGDSDNTVREKCGDPLEVTSREDKGPIWIYHFGQDRFMYYLEFVFGKLQRILSTPCSLDNYECFDLN